MNLVSVILPYYKKKFFIKECLYSIVNQTYKELEIIIVYDDENYDDLAYIKSLEFIDERFKIIINKKIKELVLLEMSEFNTQKEITLHLLMQMTLG